MRENGQGLSNGTPRPSLSRSSSAAGLPEEQMASVDLLYLKNVVLKFLDAFMAGRSEQVPPAAAPAALPLRAAQALTMSMSCPRPDARAPAAGGGAAAGRGHAAAGQPVRVQGASVHSRRHCREAGLLVEPR